MPVSHLSMLIVDIEMQQWSMILKTMILWFEVYTCNISGNNKIARSSSSSHGTHRHTLSYVCETLVYSADKQSKMRAWWHFWVLTFWNLERSKDWILHWAPMKFWILWSLISTYNCTRSLLRHSVVVAISWTCQTSNVQFGRTLKNHVTMWWHWNYKLLKLSLRSTP